MTSPGAHARFRPHQRVVAKIVMDEAVIINLETGVYYGLPGAGSVVWALVAAGHSPAEVAERVASEYAVQSTSVRGDVAALVESLVDEQLIVASDRTSADDVDIADLVAQTDYTPPALERFDDMEELLALDPPTPGALDVLMQRPDPSG
ncbi:MAG: PqqD family protein [Acidimicrobiales bacterium]